jgi:NADH:ubiquinone oxidoreductase subunit K
MDKTMPENSWSPLSYFRELHLLPRVIFTVGGALFLTALVARELVLILLSLGIIFAAVALNFILKLTWCETRPPYTRHVSWESFFQALIALAISAACIYVAAYRYRHGSLPPYLLPISK